MLLITLINNKVYGELDKKWEEIPKDLPFLRIQYILPNKQTILMEGFEQYLVMEEKVSFLNKNASYKGNKVLLGKHGNKCCQITLIFEKNKVFTHKTTWGKEYVPLNFNEKTNEIIVGQPQKTNRNDWKKGLKLVKPIVNRK